LKKSRPESMAIKKGVPDIRWNVRWKMGRE